MTDEKYTSDILQPISVKEWPHLQGLLKRSWPRFAYYYFWIETAIRWKKKDANIAVEIYCPNGKITCGTFVAISTYSECLILAYTEDLSGNILSKAMKETKRINWKQQIRFSAVHESLKSIMLSILEDMKYAEGLTVHCNDCNFYIKSSEECISADVEIPDECYLKQLDESNVSQIHSLWPFRNRKNPELTMKHLNMLILMNKGVGLFLKKDNSLVSWGLHADMGGLGMVQTEDAHQRKGYATVVVKALSREIAEQGIDPGLFVVQGNTASETLFTRLGWKRIVPVTWIIVSKE